MESNGTEGNGTSIADNAADCELLLEHARTRIEQVQLRVEKATDRAELAESRMELAETRTELAETRAALAEVRAQQAESVLQRVIQSAVDPIGSPLIAANDSDRAKLLEGLTSRQREVLRLVAEGQNTKQIADTLHLSPKTVEYHRAKLMRAVGIHDVPGLVRLAVRAGLVAGL